MPRKGGKSTTLNPSTGVGEKNVDSTTVDATLVSSKKVAPVGMKYMYFEFNVMLPHPSDEILGNLAVNGTLFPLVVYEQYAGNPNHGALVANWYNDLKIKVENAKCLMESRCKWNSEYSTDIVDNENCKKTLSILESWYEHASNNASIAAAVGIIENDIPPTNTIDKLVNVNTKFTMVPIAGPKVSLNPKPIPADKVSNSDILNQNSSYDVVKAGYTPPSLPRESDTVVITPDVRARWEKSRKEYHFKELNWRPGLLLFNIEDEIDTLNDMFIGGGYNSAECILAFQAVMNNMNVNYHDEEISSYRTITQYMNVDTEKGVFRSWSSIQEFLRLKFTYDTVYDTAKETLDNMKNIYWPKYFKNANLNEYNDTYLKCLRRTGVDYSKPGCQQICNNYVKTLPTTISSSVYTQLRSFGGNNSYLLSDYMMAAADVFAFHITNPNDKFRKRNKVGGASESLVNDSKSTKSRRLNTNLVDGRMTVEVENRTAVVRGSSKESTTFDPTLHCAYCYEHKNGKLFYHVEDKCWYKPVDAEKESEEEVAEKDAEVSSAEELVESESPKSLKRFNSKVAPVKSRAGGYMKHRGRNR